MAARCFSEYRFPGNVVICVIPLRILLASTPVGPLGSGIGGGVELTLHTLVSGLTAAAHHVQVVAPSGSLHVGECVHQIDGALQVSSQIPARDAGSPGSDDAAGEASGRAAPILMPRGSVLAAMWDKVADLQDDVDIVVNLAYDWLPLYLTRHLRVPVAHLVSMGSINDVMDQALLDLARRLPERLAAHSMAQANTYEDPTIFKILGNGIVTERYDLNVTPDMEAPLGFVGRISPEKGLEDVAALSALTGRTVRVWGMMQDEAYWDRVLADHPESSLDYRGFLPTDELQAEIGRCSAVVMTSKWVEAFGNVAIEALATGVPVITYDRGGPAEIVIDGVTGFIVSPDDVDALANAVARLGEIDRRACRQRVDDEFSSTAMAGRTLEWLDEVVELHRCEQETGPAAGRI